MVALTGIIYGAMNPDIGLFSGHYTDNTGAIQDVGAISINGILSSIPAILFAYDSFLGVASLQGEMDNPQKKVPLTIIVGMGICIVFYLFITIGQIMVGQGSAYGVFNVIFKDNTTAANALRIVLSVFILVCVLGVLNALILVALRTFQYSVQYRIFYGY